MRDIQHVSLPQTREAKEDPFATTVDTYVKPAGQLPSGAEDIIKSLVTIAPELQKYVEKQQKKHQTFGEAVGAKLYLEASDKGKDATPENIKEMLRAGELEGAAAYNKHVHNGIVKMQFKTAAEQIRQHLPTWYNTAKVIDRDGVEKHISEIDDREIFNNAVDRELKSFIWERTGGKYSPTLYQDIIQGTVNEVKHNLTAHHVGVRKDRVNQEITRSSTALLDSQLSPFINNNQFTLDENNTTLKLVSMFQDFTLGQNEIGIDPEITRQTKASYLMMKMSDVDLRGIEGLLIAAEMDEDLWDDPDLRTKLQATAKRARYNRLSQDKLEMDELLTEQKHNVVYGLDILCKQYGEPGKIPQNELETLARANPFFAKEIADIIAANQEANQVFAESGMEMDAATFNRLCLEADAGRLPVYKILGLSYGSMTKRQRDELRQRAEHREDTDYKWRSRADSGKKAYRKYKDPYAVEEKIIEAVVEREDYKKLPKEVQEGVRQAIRARVKEAWPQVAEAELTHADSMIDSYDAVGAIFDKYFNDGDVADIIHKANEKAAGSDKKASDPDSRYKRRIDELNTWYSKKSINDPQGKLRPLVARMQQPDYVPNEADKQIIGRILANQFTGKSDAERKKEITREYNLLLIITRDLGKYRPTKGGERK